MAVLRAPQRTKAVRRRNALEGFRATSDTLRENVGLSVMERLEQTFADADGPQVDTDLWVDILFDVIAAFPSCDDPPLLVESMRGLYWGRVFSFMNQTWELSSAECEEPIRQQGIRVFERRGELIERLQSRAAQAE